MYFIKSILSSLFTKSSIFFGSNKNISTEKEYVLPAPQEASYEKGYLSLVQLNTKTDSSITSNVIVGFLEEKYQSTFNSKSYSNIDILYDKDLPNEGYRLIVDTKVTIKASTNVGALYALYTLEQLVEKTSEGIRVRKCSINDFPAYSWRGLHFDVARHFFNIDVLYRLVDTLSKNKLNTLHLHLTDDQGYRIESKKYPLLHTKGSSRSETVVGKYFPFFGYKYVGDKITHSGYYTQEQLRELDKYAVGRGVEIIPEIDIPGHATAILYCYPEFAAGTPPKKVATYWGVLPNVMSASPESIAFLKDIFLEVSSIFSSKKIHLGGDEVPAKNYKKDKAVKELIEKKVIKNAGEADHYILSEIASYIKTLGKEPVFWDEARSVANKYSGTTMVWRDEKYAIDALRDGGNVVLTPSNYMYFDYYQKNPTEEPLAIGGYLPIEQVYSYRAPNNNNGKILGIQANLWTEYIKNEEHMLYMLLPRMYALSEVAWGTNNNLKDFLSRAVFLK